MQTVSNPAKVKAAIKAIRPRISGLLRLILLLLLLAGFGLYFQNNPKRFPDLSLIKWNYFIWIILLSTLANLLAAGAFQAIVRHLQPNLDSLKICRIFLLSRSMNLITPKGGTLYSAIHLKKKSGFSFTKYTATSTACTWLDLTLACLASVIALLCIESTIQRNNFIILFGATFLLSLSGITVLLLLGNNSKLRQVPLLPQTIQSKIGAFIDVLAKLLSHPRLCLTFGAWSLSSTAVHGTRLWLCFIMLQQTLPWPKAFATTIFVKASNTLSVTPGNLGVVEGIITLTGSIFGIAVGTAVVAGLIYRFSSYLALLAIGTLLILWKSDSKTKNEL